MDDKNETTTKEKTLFEILGSDAISAVVEKFYERMLSDDLVSHFFKNTNMQFQKKHMKNFITFATGGPKSYEGRDMRAAHKDMKLTDEHFDRVVFNLATTLREFSVAEELIKRLADLIEPLRNDVLNR